MYVFSYYPVDFILSGKIQSCQIFFIISVSFFGRVKPVGFVPSGRDNATSPYGRICAPAAHRPGYPLQFLSFTFGKASGISASIPCAGELLRSSPGEFRSAKLQDRLGGVWGFAPNSENQNA
jgi:hypothetical protein